MGSVGLGGWGQWGHLGTWMTRCWGLWGLGAWGPRLGSARSPGALGARVCGGQGTVVGGQGQRGEPAELLSQAGSAGLPWGLRAGVSEGDLGDWGPGFERVGRLRDTGVTVTVGRVSAGSQSTGRYWGRVHQGWYGEAVGSGGIGWGLVLPWRLNGPLQRGQDNTRGGDGGGVAGKSGTEGNGGVQGCGSCSGAVRGGRAAPEVAPWDPRLAAGGSPGYQGYWWASGQGDG